MLAWAPRMDGIRYLYEPDLHVVHLGDVGRIAVAVPGVVLGVRDGVSAILLTAGALILVVR